MVPPVLTGVNEDVELILYKFVNQKYHTFGGFSEVWKNLQFHYIYSGRSTVLEMKYFTRELLLLAKSHALSNYTMWERSGAIFLIYALYFTQPLSQEVPIRIEQNEWNELCKFVEDMKSVNMEVPFCFYKLVVNNAFDFVFSSKPYNIETMKEEEPKRPNLTVPQKKYKYDKFAMGSLLTSIGFDPNASAERESKYNDVKQKLNDKFPDLCNFELRRFAVNLLVPSVDHPEDTVSNDDGVETIKKKRKGRRKNKSLYIPLMSAEEDVIDSTLSMPLILNEESEVDDDLDEEEEITLVSIFDQKSKASKLDNLTK